jgi:hypothetical protein
MTKKFPLRVLLTVTTERLLTEGKDPKDNGIGDLYELLGWMTNDQPFTHQLPRFNDECKPWLLRWFPELANVNVDLLDDMIRIEGAKNGCEAWLDAVQKLSDCKPEYDVPRIPADDHEKKNPVDELIAMRGTDEGIVVV